MAEKPSPAEFRTFIRDLGIRAFDQFAGEFRGRAETALGRLAADWKGLSAKDKKAFFEQVIAAAVEAVPGGRGPAGSKKERKAKPQKRT